MSSINDKLIEAMEEIAQNAVSNAGYDKTRTCIVMSQANANNTYKINLDGVEYDNIPCQGGGSFNVGDTTKVYIPNNQMSQAYIQKFSGGSPQPTPESFQFPVGYTFEWSGHNIQGAPNLTTAERVAEYFGYGVWELFGVGRVSACIDISDINFATDGHTGGSKDSIVVDHTHTQQEHSHSLNSHTHSLSNHTHTGGSHTHGNSGTHKHEFGFEKSVTISSSGAHSHYGYYINDVGSGSKLRLVNSNLSPTGTTNYAITPSGGAHTHSFTLKVEKEETGSSSVGATDSGGVVATSAPSTNTSGQATGNTGTATPTINSTGSSGTNANLQPYIVVYRWRRIA